VVKKRKNTNRSAGALSGGLSTRLPKAIDFTVSPYMIKGLNKSHNLHFMRRSLVISGFFAAMLVLPALASAATGFGFILGQASVILNLLIGILITIAIVVFFWGLIQYLVNVGEEKSKGLQTMIWGIVAIFVMVSIWGLVRILQSTLGIRGDEAGMRPSVPIIVPGTGQGGQSQPTIGPSNSNR